MLIETALRAVADLTRLRILRLVATMELAVGEIAQVLGQNQPRVSRHIAILSDAGLAERRREGSWIFVRAATNASAEPIGTRLNLLLAAIESDDEQFRALCEADRHKLAAIRAAREDQAQEYFAAHAADWDELRRMHSADDMVEKSLLGALVTEPLGRVLDIGTGTGRMAELLADRADHIVALDKSPAMLRVARARLHHLGGKLIDMVQGDFANLPLPADSIDTVLFHQVLHFAQNPAEALCEAARVSRAGGRIAIVDFATHQREELRERHAHARLGFSDGQMASLLKQAGYDAETPIALDEGELVVKIWLGRLLPAARKAS